MGETEPPCSDAHKVGGPELDPVAVKVSASAVIVPGGSGVCVSSQHPGVYERDARFEGLVMAACRRERGLEQSDACGQQMRAACSRRSKPRHEVEDDQ